MKTRNAFFAAILAAAVLVGATSFFLSAGAQSMGSGKSSAAKRGAAVILQCRNYGGQQDVSKNPDIINTTKKTIPSGTRLYWSATDGDSGSVLLDHGLTPGAKVGVNGKPGQSYTCKAWMNP